MRGKLHGLEVEVECPDDGVMESLSGVVGGPAGVGEDRGVEGASEAVGGEHVVPGVAYPGRCIGDGVEDLLDAVGRLDPRRSQEQAPSRPGVMQGH